MTILHQIIAVEKGTKTRTYAAVTEIHKANQHANLFEGVAKTYQPNEEGGEVFPPESVIVQKVGQHQLDDVARHLTELFDITATKDFANTTAKADVVLDNGTVIVKDAPVSFLLFLEKQLNDVRTLIDKMPTLDPAVQWTKDPNSYTFISEPIKTHRTKKVQKPLILAPATDKHPAQTQLITEDVVVGYWTAVKRSGALPIPRKAELLARVEKLAKAVKFAREKANGAEAPEQNVGAAIFSYILA